MGWGAPGTSSRFEGKPIVDIQFSAPQPLDARDLVRVQTLKRGQPFRAVEVAQAIDGLFATERFADIVVKVQDSGNGVPVRFVTTNVMFVEGVAVSGKLVDAPTRGQAIQALNLSPGNVFQLHNLLF